MSRGLTSAQVNASAAGNRIVFPLVELYFDSGTLMFCLGSWDVTSSAGTYLHTGPGAYVKAAAENATSQEGLELGMSGLDVAAVTIAASEPYRGRLARLLKAYVDSNTHQLIGDPVPMYVGRMTNMSITEDSTTASIAITTEHYEIELTRASPVRWSDADQQRLFPGDEGCAYAASMSEKTVIWPSKAAQGG